MEAYLNGNFYGNQNYGIKAAARGYFDKELDELTLAEAAILAGIPKAPTDYDLVRNAEQRCLDEVPEGTDCPADRLALVVPPDREVVQRRDYILELMKTRSWLSGDRHTVREYEAAKREPVILAPQKAADLKAGHFVWQVHRELGAVLCGPENADQCELVDTGGYRVVTTLDWDKQQIVEKWLYASARAPNLKNTAAILDDLGIPSGDRRWLADLRGLNIHNAASAVLDARTGEVLAYGGSAGYAAEGSEQFQPQFDVLSDGYRQPGSSIKPIDYAIGIDDRTMTASSLFMDVVTDFNPSGEHKGVEAFKKSWREASLDDREREGFHHAVGGEHQDVREVEQLRNIVPPSQEQHASAEAHLITHRFEFGPSHSPTDHQEFQAGIASQEFAGRQQEHLVRFFRAERGDHHHDPILGAQSQFLLQLRTGAAVGGGVFIDRNAILDDGDAAGRHTLLFRQITGVGTAQRHHAVGELEQPPVREAEVAPAAKQPRRVRRHDDARHALEQRGHASPQHGVVVVEEKKNVGWVPAQVTAQPQRGGGVVAVALQLLGAADAGVEQRPAHAAGFAQKVKVHAKLLARQPLDDVGEHALGAAHGKRGGYERYNYFFHLNDRTTRFVTTSATGSFRSRSSFRLDGWTPLPFPALSRLRIRVRRNCAV